MAGPFVLEGAVSGSASELGAPSRARGRGGVPPLSLQRSPRRRLLACRRCPQHAGPIHVRAAQGDRQGVRPENGWMRPRRAWRFARRHPRKPRPRRFQRCRRRSAVVSRPSASRARADSNASFVAEIERADEFIRSGATPVRHVAADRAHSRGSVSAPTRHYGFARNRTVCASTRAAITGPTSIARPRHGRP